MRVRLVPAVADERFRTRVAASFVGDVEHALEEWSVEGEVESSRPELGFRILRTPLNGADWRHFAGG